MRVSGYNPVVLFLKWRMQGEGAGQWSLLSKASAAY